MFKKLNIILAVVLVLSIASNLYGLFRDITLLAISFVDSRYFSLTYQAEIIIRAITEIIMLVITFGILKVIKIALIADYLLITCGLIYLLCLGDIEVIYICFCNTFCSVNRSIILKKRWQKRLVVIF